MADEGLVVARDGQALVRAHRLCVTLHPLAKHITKRLQAHRLVLYARGSAHPLLLCTTPALVPGQACCVVLHTQTSSDPAYFVRWYASSFDKEDGLFAQELVASGTGPGPRVHMRDLDGLEVGQVHLEGLPSSSPLTSGAPHPVNEEAQALVRATYAKWQTLTRVDRAKDGLFAVRVALDRPTDLPVLWYPLHATRMRAPSAREAAQLFDHWLAVARWLAPPAAPPSLFQLLADVLALPSLAWVYRADTTSLGELTDHWCSLWAHPQEGGLHAFDCEDGAKAALELFWVLVRVPLDPREASPQLLRLQALARRYRPWMAAGELRSGDGSARDSEATKGEEEGEEDQDQDQVVMHCYLVLLPRSPEEVRARLPAITVETTSWASGAWTPEALAPATTDSDARLRKQQRAATKRLVPDAARRSNARVRAPVSLLRRDGSYGALVALFSVDPRPQGQAELRFMNRTPAMDFFVSFADGMARSDGRVAGEVLACALPTVELERILQRELALAPASVFPVPPEPAARAAVTARPPVPAHSFALLLPDPSGDLPLTLHLRLRSLVVPLSSSSSFPLPWRPAVPPPPPLRPRASAAPRVAPASAPSPSTRSAARS